MQCNATDVNHVTRNFPLMTENSVLIDQRQQLKQRSWHHLDQLAWGQLGHHSVLHI
jgi:hypothetical protein